MARGDPRWKFWWTLGTFSAQMCMQIVIIGLTAARLSSMYDPDSATMDIGPLALASWSLFSIIVYLICFFCKKLHPLVVLTLSAELMICWLAITAIHLTAYVMSQRGFCSGEDEDTYYGSGSADSGRRYWANGVAYPNSTFYHNSDTYHDLVAADQKARKHTCGIGSAVLAFNVLTVVSYIFLVGFSAVTRKRTRMPFVPAEKKPLMQAQEGHDEPEMEQTTAAAAEREEQVAVMHGGAPSVHDIESGSGMAASGRVSGSSRREGERGGEAS